MRRVAAVVFGVVLSGLGMTVAAMPAAAQQARTMSDVIDHVITNENRSIQQIRQYSPLVETYIQNQRPDRDLGTVPAGDKYFLAGEAFPKAGGLFSRPNPNRKGRRILVPLATSSPF